MGKPFYFFRNWLKEAPKKDGEKAYYFVELPVNYFYKEDRGLTMLGAYIAEWILDNSAEESIWIAELYLRHKNDYGDARYVNNGFLVFNDKRLAQKFKSWYSESFQKPKISDLAIIKLWHNKNDFDDMVTSIGKAHVSQKISYKLSAYQRYTSIVDEKAFQLWMWTRKNSHGKIWYWGSEFYFELDSDAVAFKLAHVPEKEGTE